MTAFKAPHPKIKLWLTLFSRGLILGTLAMVAWFGLHALPDAINPFSPIEITSPVGPLTNVKLRLLKPRYEACLATLKRRGIGIARDHITSTEPDCGMEKGIRLMQSPLSHGGDLELTCGLGAALMIWERNIIVPQSQEILGSPVIRLRHYGTYACRNINHAKEGRRSEHASGDAIDVAGFDLADGRKISVAKDWGKPTPEGRFLQVAHDKACSVFNVVLGPDFNAFHKDHFHLDMSIWSICK